MKDTVSRLSTDEVDSGWFLIAHFEGVSPCKLTWKKVKHGENIQGMDFLAILDGKFCDCKWCAQLHNRLQSRRVG